MIQTMQQSIKSLYHRQTLCRTPFPLHIKVHKTENLLHCMLLLMMLSWQPTLTKPHLATAFAMCGIIYAQGLFQASQPCTYNPLQSYLLHCTHHNPGHSNFKQQPPVLARYTIAATTLLSQLTPLHPTQSKFTHQTSHIPSQTQLSTHTHTHTQYIITNICAQTSFPLTPHTVNLPPSSLSYR